MRTILGFHVLILDQYNKYFEKQNIYFRMICKPARNMSRSSLKQILNDSFKISLLMTSE